MSRTAVPDLTVIARYRHSDAAIWCQFAPLTPAGSIPTYANSSHRADGTREPDQCLTQTARKAAPDHLSDCPQLEGALAWMP